MSGNGNQHQKLGTSINIKQHYSNIERKVKQLQGAVIVVSSISLGVVIDVGIVYKLIATG
jgi:hypothetical protein